MKLIFLDFDGVLNNQKYFIDNDIERKIYGKVNSFENDLRSLLSDIDFYKVMLIKCVCDTTGAKVVVTSAWRNLSKYIFVEEYLVRLGLPIIGVTPYLNGKRGKEIYSYLKSINEPVNYVVIDDERFRDFDENLLNHLIKTDFYGDGFTEDDVNEVISVLNLNYNELHFESR